MNSPKTTLLLVLLLAAALVLPITAATAQTPLPASQSTPDTGNAKNGEQLYFKYSCYACHGFSGQNGPGQRLVGSGYMGNVRAFTTYVRNPRSMPPYTAKVLPDAELADIFAYVKTLKASPAAKDIPLLNQLLNEK